ncbi:MAG TPA: uroporphyrinogen-III synthase [Xanthomonadaceae bacterium]
MPPSFLPLSGWYVVSLRPVGQHRRLLQAAQARGAQGLALPGLRLAAREDTLTRMALDTALCRRFVIFTSPAAVRFAVRLRTLKPPRLRNGQRVFALGTATAAALRRAGVVDTTLPAQANSEGLLELAELQSLRGQGVGLVTAPGGRALLAQQLRERGAELAIAEVYARAPARLDRSHASRLLEARGRGAVCVTSAEALGNVIDALPADALAVLRRCVAVVSSPRLEAIAREAGFAATIRAPAPTPGSLIDALCAHAGARAHP